MWSVDHILYYSKYLDVYAADILCISCNALAAQRAKHAYFCAHSYNWPTESEGAIHHSIPARVLIDLRCNFARRRRFLCASICGIVISHHPSAAADNFVLIQSKKLIRTD